uniref:RecA protein n=1 Tax=Pseudomonas phage Cygsa01 TaxID=3138529 RepID=A0AAU6W3N7_9VIRU
MSDLMKRMLAVTKKDGRVTTLDESQYADKAVVAHTDVPMLNVAMSSKLDGGLIPGLTMVVGESRSFKSNFCVKAMAAYLKTYADAIAIFADCEFGASKKLFTKYGIDPKRVIHVPFEDVEEMKIKLTKLINQIGEEDRVFIMVDSVSQVASRKESEDAENEKVTQDMTRARALNSFWRIITPKLTLRRIPMYAINSFYEDIGNQYAEPIIKGGKQGFLSCDQVWFVSRRQIKNEDTKQLLGWDFVINIMKGRFVKEKAKIPITVLFDGGIAKCSGLLEMARLGGFVELYGGSRYKRTELAGFKSDPGLFKKDIANNWEWWEPVVENKAFADFVERFYGINESLVAEEDIDFDPETGEIRMPA